MFGAERLDVALGSRRDHQRPAIFRPSGHGERRDADDVAIGWKGGLGHCRRVDPDLRPAAQQIFDQTVERLVRAIPDIIVIARE
jgi:hypothetical protein